MEILAAYDLTHSFRDAAELTGCSHHTVARYVRARDAGQLQTTPVQRNQVIDPFRNYIEGWVDDSHGYVRADVVQDKLEALGLGYAGSERTIRRAVAEAKAGYRAGHRRRFRPWLPEPGLWFQWDYADGPLVEGRKTWLFCAWLAWSRFRVVVPVRDKTLPTVIACIDTTLRRFGGAPTYGLSDYVPGHIITLLWPTGLCGRRQLGAGFRSWNPETAADSGHITIRATPANSGGIRRFSRLAWCGMPP